MVDTFVIWPHGTETLQRFRDPLNGLHRNIQCTMERERDGHLPFISVDIYRARMAPSAIRAYRKPTYTNVYLNPGSHHHPSHIYRAFLRCVIAVVLVQ